tara:strand:+ start:196 stop:363 length:168 start_codon:yes stop_codon:yes gene_type:complete
MECLFAACAPITKYPNPFIPVIVLTANTGIKHVCEARDTGMGEFLAKPLSARMLY